MLHHLCQFYRHKSSHQKPTTTMGYCEIHIRNQKLKWIPSSHFKNHPRPLPSAPIWKKKDPNWRNNSGHEVRSSSPKTKKKKMWCSSEIQPGWLVGRLVDQRMRKSDGNPVSLGPKKAPVWAPRIGIPLRIRNNNPGFILGDPMGIPNHKQPQTNNYITIRWLNPLESKQWWILVFHKNTQKWSSRKTL